MPKLLSGGEGRDAKSIGVRRAAQLGLPVVLGGRGLCVLPGHAADGHELELVHRGFVAVRCPACDRSFSLAEVRAITAYADVPFGDERDQKLTGPMERIRLPKLVELSRWAERLDYEAGLLTPRASVLVLPDGLSAAGRAVGEGIDLLLRVRSGEHWLVEEPFAFARRFARAWCGLSDDRARAGVSELRQRGMLLTAGKSGRALLYRPAASAGRAA